MKEAGQATGTIFYITVVLAVAVGLFSVVYLGFQKYIVNEEREITQHSNEYEQSKVTELVQSYERFQYIDTQIALYSNNENVVSSYQSQQNSLVSRMCQAYSLLPNDIREDVVPPYIIVFLHNEGCY